MNEQVPSKEQNICYCGAYGGGVHTRSARCNGSPAPEPDLITAPENPSLDDLIAFYSEGNFRSGVRVRVPYRATREALERLRAAHEPATGPVAPIACIRVGEDDTCEVVHLYAPGLPPGEHDLFPVPLNPNGQLVPSMFAELLCPHGMPRAENICGPCSEGRPNRAAQPPAVSPWIKVTHRLPESGVPVLAFVTNELGRTRRIRAQWCAKFTEESDGDDAEYCEEKDTYYSPEGWYESNEYDEVNWFVHDPVSHWMPLPEGPTATKEGEHG